MSSPSVKVATPSTEAPFPLSAIQKAFIVGRKIDGTSARLYVEFAVANADVRLLMSSFETILRQTPALKAVALDFQSQITSSVASESVSVVVTNPGIAFDAAVEAARERLDKYEFDPYSLPRVLVEIVSCPSETSVHVAVDEGVCDGPSLGLLLTRWQATYETHQAPELDTEFQSLMRSGELNTDVTVSALATNETLVDLTGTFNLRTEPGRRQRKGFRLSEQSVRLLSRWAAAQNATLASALCSVCVRALAHATGRSGSFPVVITLRDTTEGIGPFLSTSVIAVPVENEGDVTGEAVESVQKQIWAALERRQPTGCEVVRDSADGGAPVATPVVFSSMLETVPNNPGDWSAAFAGTVPLTRTPLTCVEILVNNFERGLQVSWDFDDSRVVPGAIQLATMAAATACIKLGSRTQSKDGARTAMDEGTPLQAAYISGSDPLYPAATDSMWLGSFEMQCEVAAVEAAWQICIDKHDQLRTTIYGRSRRIAGSRRIPPIAPRYVPGGRTLAQETSAILEEMALTKFDLAEWPLFRVQVTYDSDGSATMVACVSAVLMELPDFAALMAEIADLLPVTF